MKGRIPQHSLSSLTGGLVSTHADLTVGLIEEICSLSMPPLALAPVFYGCDTAVGRPVRTLVLPYNHASVFANYLIGKAGFAEVPRTVDEVLHLPLLF